MARRQLLGVLLILIAGPLLFFIRPLYKAKEEAVFQVEALVRENIGSSMPDFRAVTHLEHSLTAIHNMSLVPFSKEDT